jgi:methionyl-tRNA formyltransferase
MKIVFMGTPDFAVPSLDMLVKENYDVAAAVTQPDKPKGRGNKITPSPVKEYALNAGIRVLQPERLKTDNFFQELANIGPDLIVTAAYGKILPKAVLDLPPKGCINVHGSLLPKYRGAAPVQWTVINGETVSGITTMFMDEGIDTGDILNKKEIPIDEDMTAGELYENLAGLGAVTLKETLAMLEEGVLKRKKQDESKATYVKVIDKDLGCIDWNKPSKDVHNLVRGVNPWPGAYTFYKGEKMKIWKTAVLHEASDTQPGTIIRVDREGIAVSCGHETVLIKEVQFLNSRKMSVAEFICGHKLEESEILKQCGA